MRSLAPLRFARPRRAPTPDSPSAVPTAPPVEPVEQVEPGAGRTVRSRLRATRSEVVASAVVAVAAISVRVVPALASGGFPLNDGGLFYTMARNLQANSFLIPANTTYNGGDIPFAYPPLSIYLVALLHAVLPVGLADLFLWLPVILSCLGVAALYFLARELLPTRFHALVATAAFGVVPESYMQIIEGGGMARALGLLLALLAAGWALRYLRRGGRRDGVAAAVAGGLAVLSHPNAALFTVMAVVLLTAHVRNFGRGARILVGVAVVSAPWWASVAIRLGPMRLVSTGSLQGPLAGALGGLSELMFFAIGQEFFVPLVGLAGLLGLLLCLHRRSGLLAVWLILELVIDQRLGAMYAMVPLCLAAAYGVCDVVLPAFLRVTEYGDGLMPAAVWRSAPVRDGLLMALYMVALGSLVADLTSYSTDHAVPAATRAAYQWVVVNTPPGARFAVISGSANGQDGVQEWFPALTDRISEATPQGLEWLGADKWLSAYKDNVTLQGCASQTAACLLDWAAARGATPGYVFLPKGQLMGIGSPGDCCSSLRTSVLASPRFAVVYDGDGATIVRWLPGP
jgi:asparagine N-glycosylation enzyme membrane subunit Stt3